MASRREIIRKIAGAITPLYDGREAESIARVVVMDRLGIDFTHLAADYDAECKIDNLDDIIADLRRGRPVQYVLGHAQFCGLDFIVREGVLIPRPETEELVGQIVAATRAGARILDVGTGSGAIAVALARLIPDADVEAVDMSDVALAVAKENAERNNVSVTFHKADALGDLGALGRFDAIVSNPPYVPQSDRANMHTNVIDFEPSEALFVDDGNPLVFYRSIAANAAVMLADGGRLWFEIYEKYGDDICRMLEESGFRDIGLAVDANNKPRMVWCRK
ncbi:MAG: peptide chain release factor N(5)-glutamine methyltransferase [Alistipes sp.]